jgi:hypothetical protein
LVQLDYGGLLEDVEKLLLEILVQLAQLEQLEELVQMGQLDLLEQLVLVGQLA